MANASAPESVEVVRRDIRFDLDTADLRSWHPEGLHVAHFFNALSVFFPEGEKFFIDSVRHYRDRIDSPALVRDVKGFVGQEAMHSREHRRYNAALERIGLPIAELDGRVKAHLEAVCERTSPQEQLAVTIALEHFTAIMAHALLTEKEPMAGAPRDVVKLWQWHAIEEIEHKSVAYDTYVFATRNLSAFRRWAIRANVMLIISFQFWRSVLRHMGDFFRQDGINTPRTWWRVCKFLLVKPGMLRRVFLSYMSYYRPGFHPWLHDDRELIAKVERELL